MSTVNLPKILFLTLVLILIPHLGLAESETSTPQKVLHAELKLSAFQLKPHMQSDLTLKLNIQEGFKAYADQFKIVVIQPIGFKVSKLKITPLQEFYDKFTKKTRQGVKMAASIQTIIEAPEKFEQNGSVPIEQEIQIELTYQACSEQFCLFPEKIILKSPIELLDESSPAEPSVRSGFFNMQLKDVFKLGLFWTFIFVFFAGVLTSFTPCIFPMIPITLSVLGRNAHTRSRLQNFIVSNLYVFGIAATYSIMGVVAASTGALFGSFMSHPIVLSLMCLIFLAMSFSMFGMYELEAPAFIQNRFSSSSDLTGYSGAFISGILSGVVASPCVGPVLVGILTYIAKTQNLWLGFFLMFVYALGMGQIFLIMGAFSQVTKLLPKSGPWLDGVKHTFGLLMLGVFFYYLNLLVPQRFWDIAFGIGLSAVSGYFGAFSSPHAIWKWIRKGILASMILVGGAFLIVGIFDLRETLKSRMIEDQASVKSDLKWEVYSEALLQKAVQNNRPVIVDFSADWCAACKELDQFTFSDPQFQILAKQFVLLKFDATNSSPELDALREKYQIVGLPTLLFFNRSGKLMPNLTLTAFEEASGLIARLKKVAE